MENYVNQLERAKKLFLLFRNRRRRDASTSNKRISLSDESETREKETAGRPFTTCTSLFVSYQLFKEQTIEFISRNFDQINWIRYCFLIAFRLVPENIIKMMPLPRLKCLVLLWTLFHQKRFPTKHVFLRRILDVIIFIWLINFGAFNVSVCAVFEHVLSENS